MENFSNKNENGFRVGAFEKVSRKKYLEFGAKVVRLDNEKYYNGIDSNYLASCSPRGINGI